MNKTHRIVWSAARQAYIVAHEHATACGKPASTRAAAVLVAGLLAATPALAADGITCTEAFGTCYVGSTPTGGPEANITVSAGATIDASQDSFTGDAILVENGTGNPLVTTQVGTIDNKGTLLAGLSYSGDGGSAGIKVSGNVAVSGDIIHSGTINSDVTPADGKERSGIVITSSATATFYAVNPDNQLGSPVIEGGVKVEADGVIHAWHDGSGILVQGDPLNKDLLQIKGGIDNAGEIYALNGHGAAITVQDATVGHIRNSGKLITDAGGDAGNGSLGLFVGSSNVGSHITNAADGVINSHVVGINIVGSTVGDGKVGDGVFNRGEINSAVSSAIVLDKSWVKGDVINEGTLTAYGRGYSLFGTTVDGIFENKKTIKTTDGEGVLVYDSTIEGVVRNSGLIQAGEPDGGGDNNTGYSIEHSILKGGLENVGTIFGREHGVYVLNSTVNGGFKNAGSIEAGKDAVVVKEGSVIEIGIENSGSIKAHDGYGLAVRGSTIQGSVINAAGASISAGKAGIYITSYDDDSMVSGNVINAGQITAGGSAIRIKDTKVGNYVANSVRGQLIAKNHGIHLGDGWEALTDGNKQTEVGGKITNFGSIEAGQNGIFLNAAKAGGVGIYGDITAGEKAVALYEGAEAGGLTIAGGGKPVKLDGKQFALFAQGQTQFEKWDMAQQQQVTVIVPAASFGGIALAGSTRIVGDIYAQNDALTVKGSDNRISGALDVKQLLVESGGELVLDSLASSSTAWKGAHPDADPDELAKLPTLADALKTSDGTHNHGRLVLAKAETYKVIGYYHQTSDATLAVRATGDTSYSQLKVEGMAALDSGTKIDVDVRQDGEIAAGATSSNTLFNSNRLAGVIQATNLVSDGKFSVSDNSALFDFSAEKTGNNVDLVLKKLVKIEQVVKDNKGSVPLASADAARVLDKIADRLVADGNAGAMAPVIDALGKLGSDAGLAQAVEQLTPALPSAALSAVSDSLGAINRVVQARVEGNIGLSSGDELSAERYVWVKPFGSYAQQDARSETAGFKANTGGLVFGADAAISPKLRLGAALAYAHSDVDGKSASAPQSSKVDVYQLIGYGSVQLDGNTELNFQLDGGRNRNQGERQLPFMGLTASSDYDSLSYHMGAGIGRTFALPRAASTTPSLRLDYTRIKEDGYSETGAGAANLTNGKRSVEQTLLAVDNRVTLPLNERQSVALNAGAAYDLMDDGATLTSAFAGEPGAVFSTASAGQSRWLWRAGLGYTYKADTGKGGLELTTRLDGEWRKGGYSNATASVKARYAF